jgi:hypothetical protein
MQQVHNRRHPPGNLGRHGAEDVEHDGVILVWVAKRWYSDFVEDLESEIHVPLYPMILGISSSKDRKRLLYADSIWKREIGSHVATRHCCDSQTLATAPSDL